MPQPDRPPPPPGEIKTGEELYLTGLRIEQFHDPALEPEPYWDEALRRDSGDARVHTALGIRQFKQARYAEAEGHLRKALERLTAGYAAPRDGEPYYYLGLALREQGRTAEAGEALFKATWSLAWRGPAYFALAELATRRHDLAAALDLVDRSLRVERLNTRALNLKAAILRHLERPQDALKVLEIVTTSKADPLDVRSHGRALADYQSLPADARLLTDTMMAHPATAAETAAEYQSAGLWDDGRAVLAELVADAAELSRLSPMVVYDLAFFSDKLGAANTSGRVPPAGPQGFAGLRLPLPARGHRGPAVRDAGGSERPAGSVLPGQPALRLAARGSREALGKVGRARSCVADGAPQPGDCLVAPAARQRPRQGHCRAREGRRTA